MTSVSSFAYVVCAYIGVGAFFVIALVGVYLWQRRLDT